MMTSSVALIRSQQINEPNEEYFYSLTDESPLTLTQQKMMLRPVEYRSDPSNHSEKKGQNSGQQKKIKQVIQFYLL